MAFTRDLARERVKRKAYIPAATVTWDSDINGILDEVVRGLPPRVLIPGDPVLGAVNADEETITYPAGVFRVAQVEVADDTASPAVYRPYGAIKNWNGKVYLSEAFDAATVVRLWPLVAPTVDGVNGALATTLPERYEEIVVYQVLGALYDEFAGDKRQYTLYVGAAGKQGNEDMRDAAADHRGYAEKLIDDRVPLAHRGL